MSLPAFDDDIRSDHVAGTPWILLDTETTGFKAPVFVVELAAQRMRGWAPDGAPFRRMLNHGIEIPPGGLACQRLHAGDPGARRRTAAGRSTPSSPTTSTSARWLPTTCSYDLDQVLRPEWERLGIEPIG